MIKELKEALDRVSGELFRNAGTGAFVVRADEVPSAGGG